MLAKILKQCLILTFIMGALPLQGAMLKTIRHGLNVSKLYKKVHGRKLVEITEDLLASGQLDPDIEQAIRIKGRRVFLFEYPSNAMQIKGYISFVPNSAPQKLLVFFRGGSGIYLIRSPANRANFWGNHTIIASTYRGGPSPGRDEFGGGDVDDMKHLIDYIPSLEKELGIDFTRGEKIAVGFSRGAMQLFLLLSRYPEMGHYFDRALSICGVLDLEHFLKNNQTISYMIRFFLFQRPTEKWIDERNPLKVCDTFPRELPLLVLQGRGDQLIDLTTGKTMVKRLNERGCQACYLEHETAGHCHRSLDPMILRWLDQGG